MGRPGVLLTVQGPGLGRGLSWLAEQEATGDRTLVWHKEHR